MNDSSRGRYQVSRRTCENLTGCPSGHVWESGPRITSWPATRPSFRCEYLLNP